MKISPTAKAMAEAVLRGDKVAARGLCDLMMEEENLGVFRPAVRVLGKNVKVVMTTHPELGGDVVVDGVACKKAVDDWLSGREVVLISMGMRVELYEFPAGDDE